MLDAQITEDKKARAFVRPNYEPTDDYTPAYVEHLGEYLGLIGPLTRQSTRLKVTRCLSDFLMACRGRYGQLIAWPTHQRHYIDAPYGRKIAERVKEVILFHGYITPSEKSSVREKLAERFLVNYLTPQDLKFTFHGIGPLIEVRESKQRGSQKKKSKTIPLTQFPETEVDRLRKQMNQIVKLWRDQPLEGKLGEIWASGKRIFNNSNLKHGGRVYGDWQSLDEEQRLQLTIGGKEVCEVDLKACYPFIIAATSGHPDQISDDPYSKCERVRGENDPAKREKMRSAMKRFTSAYVAKTGNVTRFPQGKHKDENGKTIPFKKEFGLRKNEKARDWVKDLEEAMPYMKEWRSDSFQLMYLESEMMVDCLVELAKVGIACYPVHDSMIVPVKDCEVAVETLKKTMIKHFGVASYLDITYSDGTTSLIEPSVNQVTTKKSSILFDYGLEEEFDLIEEY